MRPILTLKGFGPSTSVLTLILASVWRVLNRHNNDWPLAVCDYSSIDDACDTVENDLIFRDAPSENVVLRGNVNHRWYYLSDQDPDDVLLFRNTSSRNRVAPRKVSTGKRHIARSHF